MRDRCSFNTDESFLEKLAIDAFGPRAALAELQRHVVDHNRGAIPSPIGHLKSKASRSLVLCLLPAALGSAWVGLERSTVERSNLPFRDSASAGRRFIPLLWAAIACK